MQRVKDTERFLAELERPMVGVGQVVTEEDIKRDGENFIAFAAAFGVKPPSPTPGSPAASA